MSTLVIILNIILSAGICVLAFFAWSRVRNALVLFIGLAFGLFAISHLVAAFGLAKSAEEYCLVARSLKSKVKIEL